MNSTVNVGPATPSEDEWHPRGVAAPVDLTALELPWRLTLEQGREALMRLPVLHVPGSADGSGRGRHAEIHAQSSHMISELASRSTSSVQMSTVACTLVTRLP